MTSERRKGASLMAATGAILGKDLKLEFRTFETLTVTAIFTTATFLIFHFALNRGELFGDLAAGSPRAALPRRPCHPGFRETAPPI